MANALRHVKSVGSGKGGLATVVYCPFCPASKPFMVRIPKGQTGVGRGYGLSMSSQARSKVARHIKVEHPEKADRLASPLKR